MMVDREQELGRLVAMKRGELLEALTPSEQKTTQRHGSAYPDTFEEHAKYLSQDGHPRARWVAPRLKAFQDAVNALWVYEIEARLPERLVKTWRQKHRGYSWISAQDLEAEVIFLIRYFIVRYNPESSQDAQLFSYAYRGVHQKLTEWAANQGPVELPTDAKRIANPEYYRKSTSYSAKEVERWHPERDGGLADDWAQRTVQRREELNTTHNPEEAYIDFLDGHIQEEDL